MITKKDLIKLVASETGLTFKQTGEVLSSLISNISKGLAEESKVRLDGLGIFDKVHRKSRMARNPQTGQEIKVKARNAIKFKPSKNLRDFVN